MSCSGKLTKPGMAGREERENQAYTGRILWYIRFLYVRINHINQVVFHLSQCSLYQAEFSAEIFALKSNNGQGYSIYVPAKRCFFGMRNVYGKKVRRTIHKRWMKVREY